MTVRDAFIAINAEFMRLLGNEAQLVNVGSGANSGDGESAPDALAKILMNLKLVEAKAK